MNLSKNKINFFGDCETNEICILVARNNSTDLNLTFLVIKTKIFSAGCHHKLY